MTRRAVARFRCLHSLAQIGGVLAMVALVIGPASVADAQTSRPQRTSRSAEDPAAKADLDGARAVFQANLDAIRRRDRSSYLGCYLESDALARSGPTGFRLGFRAFADQASANPWPDFFSAQDLRLIRVREGLVYGTYRYRVRYGDEEQLGLSERLFVNTERGWKIAVTSAFPETPGTPPPPVAITGGTLIDGTGKAPVRDAVVVLRDGAIECAGPRGRCRVPAGIDTVDARGLWITPGLIDAHVHYSQTGWVDGRPDAVDVRETHPYEEVAQRLREHPEAFHRSYLASGVTGVFDVGGYPWTLSMQEPSELDTRGPHVAAAGPLLSTLDFWLNLPGERQFLYMKDEAAVREGVRYLRSIGAAAVKVWFIPVKERDFEEMTRLVILAGEEARRARLPLIVHATGLKEAKAALRANPHLLVHSVMDATVDAEFLRQAKRTRTIYCPTITVMDGYHRVQESLRTGRPPQVDDPHGAVDSLTIAHVTSTPKYAPPGATRSMSDTTMRAMRRTMATNLKKVWQAKIPIAMGTDAGNPLTLHGPAVFGEMEAMQRAGMTPMAVITASTRGGAEAMGRGEDLGTVEAGKAADLLLLEANPAADVTNFRRLRYVVRGGVVRPIEELRVGRGRTMAGQ